MNNFKTRSYTKELLDEDNIPFIAIKQNMKELNIINKWLGGHAITTNGVKSIIQKASAKQLNRPIIVCEIGCGGGDNLFAINKWATKNNISIIFIGIDIKKECINFAKQQYPTLNTTWIAQPFQEVTFTNKPDIIFSSLFCHHFTNDEIIEQLKWLKNNSNIGFFINDLHRNIFAYHSIKFITTLFSNSYLVKNDAPLSVARGFTKNEWNMLLIKANIDQAKVLWQWAFRHLIIYTNE